MARRLQERRTVQGWAKLGRQLLPEQEPDTYRVNPEDESEAVGVYRYNQTQPEVDATGWPEVTAEERKRWRAARRDVRAAEAKMARAEERQRKVAAQRLSEPEPKQDQCIAINVKTKKRCITVDKLSKANDDCLCRNHHNTKRRGGTVKTIYD
jgi:hypothetical protein